MGMVSVLATRPSASGRTSKTTGGDDSDRRPLSIVVALSGASALILGLVPITGLAVLSWLTSTWNTPDAAGSPVDAMRVGLHLWLAGHHVPITLAGAPMTVAPLGITLLAAATLAAAGGQVARRALILDWMDVAKAACGLGGIYGVGLMLTAALAQGSGSQTAPGFGLLAGFILGGLAGGGGVLRRTPALRRSLRDLLPPAVRAGAVGALVTVAAIVTGGVVLAVTSLIVHRERVGALFYAYHAGWFSTVVLALVCLALLPNAALFGTAYLLGPGFSIGTSTLVSPMVVQLGAVPSLPLLGGLPAPGQPPVSMVFAFSLAVLAGGLGIGAALRYAARDGDDWGLLSVDRAALRGLLTGLGAAVVTTGLVLLAGGSWGDGRLTHMGAPALPTVALSVAWFGLTGALGGTLWWLIGRGNRVLR